MYLMEELIRTLVRLVETLMNTEKWDVIPCRIFQHYTSASTWLKTYPVSHLLLFISPSIWQIKFQYCINVFFLKEKTVKPTSILGRMLC